MVVSFTLDLVRKLQLPPGFYESDSDFTKHILILGRDFKLFS